MASSGGVDFLDLHRAAPGGKFRLRDADPSSSPGLSGKNADERARAERETREHVAGIAALQERLYAEGRRALLVIFQAMDTGGKDGAVRDVFTGVNPQGVRVTGFKRPSEEELAHDFLWRVHHAVPARGLIGVWNRSHYEDVLVVRVHGLVDKGECRRRYEAINAFEQHLTEQGVGIVKCFLHISKDEQRERLAARLADPEKRWKFNAGDLAEREKWDDYMEAYEDAIRACSTEHAPWHVIPADKKWYRSWAAAGLVRAALDAMKPRFPKSTIDPAKVKIV